MATIAGPDSLGDADAVALTFAQQVAPVKKPGPVDAIEWVVLASHVLGNSVRQPRVQGDMPAL